MKIATAIVCYGILVLAAPVLWLAHTFYDSQRRFLHDMWDLHKHVQSKLR